MEDQKKANQKKEVSKMDKHTCKRCGAIIREHVWCDELECYCSIQCKMPMRTERVIFIIDNYKAALVNREKSQNELQKWGKAIRNEFGEVPV